MGDPTRVVNSRSSVVRIKENSMPSVGKIVQITGPVVDIEFPPDQLPEIYNAVEVLTSGSLAQGSAGEGGSGRIILEVQQHLGNDWVRAVAMTSAAGMPCPMTSPTAMSKEDSESAPTSMKS